MWNFGSAMDRHLISKVSLQPLFRNLRCVQGALSLLKDKATHQRAGHPHYGISIVSSEKSSLTLKQAIYQHKAGFIEIASHSVTPTCDRCYCVCYSNSGRMLESLTAVVVPLGQLELRGFQQWFICLHQGPKYHRQRCVLISARGVHWGVVSNQRE